MRKVELSLKAAAKFNGSLRTSMTSMHRTQITARRHPGDIKTMEEWRAAA
jgi:hypothetical protein